VSITFRVEPEDAELTVILPNGTRKALGSQDRGYDGLTNEGGVIIEASAKGHETLQKPLPQYNRRTVIEELVLKKAPVAAPITARPKRPIRRPVRQPASNGCQGEDCPPTARPKSPKTRKPKVIVRAPPKPKGTGTLKLLAKPPAVAIIDGKGYGWTPLINVKLPAGNRKIELIREGVPQPYRKTIRVYIEKDKSLKRIVTP
jgi:hypothetical protein